MKLHDEADPSPGVTLVHSFDFAAPPGISGKLQVSRFQTDGNPCLTFRSADMRVSQFHFLMSLNH